MSQPPAAAAAQKLLDGSELLRQKARQCALAKRHDLAEVFSRKADALEGRANNMIETYKLRRVPG